MTTTHEVKSGETLLQIAQQHGFQSWRRLWDAPENAELRDLRQAPEAIQPGDVLTVPERKPMEHKIAPGDRVELKLQAAEALEVFEVGFFHDGPSGAPLAGCDVQLMLPGDSQVHSYLTNSAGVVRVEGPLVAKGKVRVIDLVDASADPTIEYQHFMGQTLRTGQSHQIHLPHKRHVADTVAAAVGATRRAGWGASPPKIDLDQDWNYTTIVIHHSGDGGERTPQGLQDEQMGGVYDDIAYEYVVGLDGSIWEGRHLAFKSAANSGRNTGKIAIIVAGDFEHQWWDDDDDPTPAALDSVVRIVNELKKHFALTKLIGHRDIDGKTKCPGGELYKHLPTLRTRTGLP